MRVLSWSTFHPRLFNCVLFILDERGSLMAPMFVLAHLMLKPTPMIFSASAWPPKGEQRPLLIGVTVGKIILTPIRWMTSS